MSRMYQVGIITLSDRSASGEREDKSGPLIEKMLPADAFEIICRRILPDERGKLEEALKELADEKGCQLILTTGGTGLSPRDVTPEATLAVADRNVPGIAEAVRAYSMTKTKRAMLSRAASVIRGRTLIINLPGSPKAVAETLEYLLDILPHGLETLSGRTEDCAR